MKRKFASSSSSSSQCINNQPPMIPKTRKKKKKQSASTTETPVPRTSNFRGVTKHRMSGKFEAHIWDKKAENINKKGKQGLFF
ncbi:hypothetical protein Hanom_Chr09g00814851 [Helianthus anomalus]